MLGERLKTMQSEYKTDIARLSQQMAEDRAEAAKQDKDNLRWQVGLWIAAVVILGVLLRWSAS